MVRTALLCSLVLATSGCFIPVPFNEPGSPLVVGQYRQRDGTPAAGTRAAVTHDPYDAATCNGARVLAVTDSAGTFRLPATTVRRRGLLLIPPIERFWNSYGLCLSTADSLLRLAAVGAVSLGGRDRAKTDSLACLEWVWQDEAHVTCWTGGDSTQLPEGGSWANAGGAGFYRLIVVQVGQHVRHAGVFLQWVERPAAGPPERVRETLALPLAPRPMQIDSTALRFTSGGRPCVYVHSTGRPRHWWSWGPVRHRVAFVLGPPGNMRPVPNCTSDRAAR